MSKTHEVIIDGVRYLPATEVHVDARGIAEALIRRYMGVFHPDDFDEYSRDLQVIVTEDAGSPSVAETVAEIMEHLQKREP